MSQDSLPLADRTERVSRSPIREMFDLAHEYRDRDLVHLEIGEPDFDTPEHIIDAASEALRDGATHYTSSTGTSELRNAISDDLGSEYVYDPESEIIVTAGAVEALALACITVVDPDDEIIIPSPAWPNYQIQSIMTGAEVVDVPLDEAEGFALDTDLLIDQMSDETAAVLLTSPSNPTGQIFDTSSTAEVVEAAAEHDAYVIADEVYKDIVYDQEFQSVAGSTAHPEHVITVGSCSKTYSMTGWRVGWFAADETVVDAALEFHESIVTCAPAPSQKAAVEALTGDQSPVQSMLSAFSERRDYVVDRVDDLPNISCPEPDGAFYAFLDCSELEADSTTIAKQLLEEHGVVVVPGVGFGDHLDDYIRISFANSLDRLELGFDRIESYLESAETR
ncbi:aminotransferase class I/II-fold pyridoxal phosphate-dependent enzyme [Natronomonas gomsonensis]|jgi:aspartate aminotransferase|uniref:pyridoxal phosphate-dependent aminotransferase n=1 Tax=Natronomonas gomsonensis TaxID=1046043 RepID=UPI0020CA35A5|nr:aminotransferase class I/II-fold pyridoxal phosphate-dependent enzyme [Natronomonas gomsonensis]MCY4730642.1 aminotransferase class I/II-fold pyridoxal phosphate-dependent enzyme [Natronomonas gomsonensis]